MKSTKQILNRVMIFSTLLMLFILLSNKHSTAQTTDTYTTTGSWIAPAGVTSVTIECWGAGGNGGAGANNKGGGGGGGGAYSYKTNIPVVAGNSYTVNVGLVSGDRDSWFDSDLTILAKGGSDGVVAATGIGGAGGQEADCIGDYSYSGGTGGNGDQLATASGGGGGSSAGTSAAGNAGAATVGGTAPAGGGNGGDGGTDANGSPGSAPGGGGGAGGDKARAGASGANGKVNITYTVSNDKCPSSTSVAPGTTQTLCQGDASTQLTATISTTGADGNPTLLYEWYYNDVTNTNDPLDADATAIGVTSQTYSPSSASAGTGWYFCVGYATDNSCAQSNDNQALASSTVQVDVTGTPTTSNAGGPQTICVTGNATLAANSATVGTGAWSVVSGSPSTNLSQFSNTASNTATFTPDGGAGSYVLRWTISNSPCTASTSDVTITVNPEPTTSVAGGDQEICDGSGATLGANSPTDGTGAWSIVSGSPSLNLSQFNNTASNTATFTPDGGVGDYVLRWTISNSPCTPSISDLTITVISLPETGAISGPTTVTASTSGLVYSITPITGATNYTWTVPGSPGAWTLNSGQGTSSITVTSGTAASDPITVYVTNTCGDDPTPSSLTVNIGVAPDCPTSTAVTPTGIQTVCEDVATSQLTDVISSSGGSGSYTGLYQWYYNTSNSNTISGATTIGGATASTYTPLSTSSEIGNRWYFCVGYATDNTCAQTDADQSLASNAVQITVNPNPGTPTAISGTADVAPSTGGLVYSTTSTNADTDGYTWTLPTGWTQTGGGTTNSITVTSGTDGQNGDITVTASNSCGTSAVTTLAVTSSAASNPPTITLGSNPEVCQGTTSANLTYSATSESPDQYSINYDVTAEGEGFVDIVDNALPASPIGLVVPIAAAGATYNGILTVKNSGSGLSSGDYSISVTVNTVKTATIEGVGTVEPNTSGYAYYVTAVSGATNYTWSVPSGWTINSGNGTENISVTTGNIGDDGNVSLIITNSCGDGSSTNLAVAVVDPTVADHVLTTCSSCHTFHNAVGGTLTNASNEGLCLSCHVTGQMAETMPFLSSDKAIPGTSGNSHSWDVLAVNSTYETVIPTDANMAARLTIDNKIVCSTCHDQHNSAAVSPYLRIDNTDDAMCKDCHSPRNVGLYTDVTPGYGSHPVGNTVVYNDADARFNTSPTALLSVSNSDKIQCSSCHGVHDVNNTGTLTTDGNLLKSTNDNTLCLDCHAYTGHQGETCITCHQVHNTSKDNIYMIRDIITTPSSGDKTVVFTAETGTNSQADGDATYDGICEVCHTTNASTYHYNTAAGDHSHEAGNKCTDCHTHDANFAAPACSDCHIANFPGWGTTDGHFAHTSKYSYACNTCHFERGSGTDYHLFTDPLDVTDGVAEVNINPNGLATRNGADAITPVLNGDKTCDNVYCHSDGRSAYRGAGDGFVWSATLGPQTAVYATTPAWTSPVETINTCTPCHLGKGNMNSPYTITEPGPITSTADYPATGAHPINKGAHGSPDQLIIPYDTHSWSFVQCFWCHETNNNPQSGVSKMQGTYGTSLHVDGAVHFLPHSFSCPGECSNDDAKDWTNQTDCETAGWTWNTTGGTMTDYMSYSKDGSAVHCGQGKTCW